VEADIAVGVRLIRARYSSRDGTVSLTELELDPPTLAEFQSIYCAIRSENTLRIMKICEIFSDGQGSLQGDMLSLWNIVCDLYRAIIIFGYFIHKDKIRNRMIRTWISYVYNTLQIKKELQLKFEFETTQLCTDVIQSSWIKCVKFRLAAFATIAKDSSIYPKKPCEDFSFSPGSVIDSKFFKWFEGLKRKGIEYKMYRFGLIDTICRGVKKGADRASDDDCKISNISTFKKLTEFKEIKRPVSLNGHWVDHTTMLEEVRRTVIECLHQFPLEKYDLGHLPSLSACTENSRAKGGCLSVVKEFLEKTETNPKSYENELVFEKQNYFCYHPSPLDHFNDTEEHNPMCREPLQTWDTDRFRAIQKNSECMDRPLLKVSLREREESLLDTRNGMNPQELARECIFKDEGREIRPVALKEALKVRGITTPGGVESWLLKPLQQHVAKALSHFDVFALTHQPITSEVLNNSFKFHDTEAFYVSGDYDDATNNMRPEYTRVCIKEICKVIGLGGPLASLAERSLCDNLVSLGDKEIEMFLSEDEKKNDFLRNKTMKDWQKFFKRIPQRGAQPMGKVLSFVCLCLINLAVVRKAMEIDRDRHMSIHNLEALINGDDCVFQMRNPKIWEEVSSFPGLENSIGKTFYSKEFIEMNSRSFLVSGGRPLTRIILGKEAWGHEKMEGIYDHKFIEVPFVNFGLMKGLVRSQSCEENARVEFVKACVRMGACHTELIRNFDCFYNDLDFLFKFYHNKYLMHQSLSGLPYYIPQWLGGLGLTPGPEYYEKIKYQHLQAAELIYRNFSKKKVVKLHDVPNCEIDLEIQRLFRRKLRELGIDEQMPFEVAEDFEARQHILSEDGQTIYSLMVTEIWRNREVKSYFKDPSSQDFELQSTRELSRSLHKNGDLWKQAHRRVQKNPFGPILPFYKLWTQPTVKLEPIVFSQPDSI
jgi:hypothetical protein